MTSPRLGSLTAICAISCPLFAAVPLTPPAEEWPPIEPAPAIAAGFQQTDWAEFQWRDEAWAPTYRQEFAYDTQARLESVRRESWFMNAWKVEHVETMSYDDAGRLAEKIRQEAVGIALHNRGRFTYDHHEAGTIRIDLAAWSHEQRWMPLTQEIHVFDEQGRLVEHIIQRHHGNLTRGQFHIRHTYDSAGRRTQILRQREQAGSWVDADRLDFTYDEHGHLTQAAWFVMGRGQWTPGIQITHEYDSAGRRSVSHRHTRGPADGFEVTSRSTHVHDGHGNEIERRHQQKRGDAWHDVRKETFAYRARP